MLVLVVIAKFFSNTVVRSKYGTLCRSYLEFLYAYCIAIMYTLRIYIC